MYAYYVDCERRQITLYTEYRDREPHEFADVVFYDVVAHDFEHSLSGNVLFDVDEVDVDDLVEDEAGRFRDSWRHGWPAVEYAGDLAVLVTQLRSAKVRAFRVDASHGLSGWVLAASCDRVVRSSRASFG